MSGQKKASFGFLMRIVNILILEDPLHDYLAQDKRNYPVSAHKVLTKKT